jgi:hypothetical protein
LIREEKNFFPPPTKQELTLLKIDELESPKEGERIKNNPQEKNRGTFRFVEIIET